MFTGATIFAQLMHQVPWRRFQTCVRRYHGDRKVKQFKCSDHFRVLAFAQLTYRESLRDIETCLRAMSSKLYHMGIHSKVSRNNLSHANEKRDWRIYADFAQVLIAQARRLYAHEELGIDLCDHLGVPLWLHKCLRQDRAPFYEHLNRRHHQSHCLFRFNLCYQYIHDFGPSICKQGIFLLFSGRHHRSLPRQSIPL